MQTYAPADAPRAAPVLAAHCGRSAPGSALTCRRSPSSPSRIAPGMRHAPTDAGRIAARRLPGRSLLTRAGLPIHTSAGLALALRLLTARHAACKWRVGHRRRGKPPAGLRCAQRNHASGLRPWVFFPATAAPSPPSGACDSPLATVCPPGPPAPLQAPAVKPVRGQQVT